MLDKLTEFYFGVIRGARRSIIMPVNVITMFSKHLRKPYLFRTFCDDTVSIGEHKLDTDGVIAFVGAFWLFAFMSQITPFLCCAHIWQKILGLITLMFITSVVWINGWSTVIHGDEVADTTLYREDENRNLFLNVCSGGLFILSIPALVVYIIFNCIYSNTEGPIKTISGDINIKELVRRIIAGGLSFASIVCGFVMMLSYPAGSMWVHIGILIVVSTITLPYGLITIVKMCHHIDWIDDVSLDFTD